MIVERESETYLEFCQTSMVELFSENIRFLAFLTVNYFRIKAPSKMFDWVLNTPLINLQKKCKTKKGIEMNYFDHGSKGPDRPF